MSWGALRTPHLVNVGDEIQVKVLKFDKDKQRVSLGFKQLTPDPWLDAAERYPVGARVKGRVLSVTTTARLWNWSKASKAWFTSPR